MYLPSRVIAGLLAIFFGGLGLHQIYLRRYNVGIVWLLVSLVFCWTLIVPIVLAVVGFIQGIIYLLYDKESWQIVYGIRSQT